MYAQHSYVLFLSFQSIIIVSAFSSNTRIKIYLFTQQNIGKQLCLWTYELLFYSDTISIRWTSFFWVLASAFCSEVPLHIEIFDFWAYASFINAVWIFSSARFYSSALARTTSWIIIWRCSVSIALVTVQQRSCKISYYGVMENQYLFFIIYLRV